MNTASRIRIVSVLVVAACLIAWPIVSASSRQGVLVTTDARPITCTNPNGTTVAAVDHAYVQYIRLVPEMNCVISFHVLNTGAVPVQLVRATFTILGDNGETAYIDNIDESPGSTDGTGLDSTALLGERTLAPGESHIITAHLRKSKETCYQGEGVAVTFEDAPHLQVRALGITGDNVTVAAQFGFAGTTQSFDDICRHAREVTP